MKKQSTIDLSVVILNFNTRDLTKACLDSVLASDLGTYQMEVIVCDNGSTDGSIPLIRTSFPNVRLIQNGKNIGFAAGNNPGIRVAKGRYVLLLNSDTEVFVHTFQKMIRFMDEHTNAGASTCKLVLPNGSMDPACHRGFPTPWASLTYLVKLERLFPRSYVFGQYHQGYKDVSQIHEVDCIVGAFFLVRREVIEQIGLLDEEYFMYGEDIDWAYRIRKAGWKIFFNPHVETLHKKKQSGRSNASRDRRIQTEVYFHTYNWLFYRKNYESVYGPVLSFFVNAFYTTRLLLLKRFGI